MKIEDVIFIVFIFKKFGVGGKVAFRDYRYRLGKRFIYFKVCLNFEFFYEVFFFVGVFNWFEFFLGVKE